MSLQSFAPATKKALTRTNNAVLQRQCACGNHTHGESECETCKQERESGSGELQRSAINAQPIAPPSIPVNEPDDAYEQEADQVAEVVMHSSAPPLPTAPDDDSSLIEPNPNELTHGGEPLSSQTAAFYEERFGRDFSSVRVHSGKSAEQYNDAVNAHAFTFGDHIWLGRGLAPQPSHILAHELAHVVQQTQPPALEDAPVLRAARRRVQRFAPYWEPYNYNGTRNHREILPHIGRLNKIFTEAPVPNADSKGVDFDKKGIADLYKASTTAGLYFAGYQDGHPKPVNLPSNRDLRKDGGEYAHIASSAPRVIGDRVVRTALAPTNIEIGDLKPSHGTIEALEGTDQVRHYLGGFEKAREETNLMPADRRDGTWSTIQSTFLPRSLTIPDRFLEPNATGQDSISVVLKHNGRVVKSVKPRPGKVFVKADPTNDGIWNYIWKPDTPVSPSELPASVVSLGADIQTKIINPLLVSPVKTAKKSRLRSPIGILRHPNRRIQRAPRGRAKTAQDVVDPFDYPAWKTSHSQLTGDEKKLEKTPEFKQAESTALVTEDREAARKSGFETPATTASEAQTTKTIGKVQFWTGMSSAVFGRLRYWFGGAFVKVAHAYLAIRDRFQNLLDGKQHKGKSGLIGKAIKVAFEILKVAGRIIIERTATRLAESLERGLEKKLKSLIPQDKIEDFETKVKQIEETANQLETSALQTLEGIVKGAVGPYEDLIKTISEVESVVSTINDIVKLVRWGARVVACLSPPGWGCLWILAEAALEELAALAVDTCWFKEKVAPLVTKVDFVAKLPGKLAMLIIEQIRRVIPADYHDIFADIDTSSIAIDPKDVCTDTGEGPSPEQLALARVMEKVGEEKWAAWAELLEKSGIKSKTPLTVAQIEEMGAELEKADLSALKDAANLYPLLPQDKAQKVVKLTTFLDRVKGTMDQMIAEAEGTKKEPSTPADPVDAGQGGGGDGTGDGEDVLRVPPSDTPLPGTYDRNFPPTVISGVKSSDYKGHKVQVDVAVTISGHTLVIENVEAVVTKRVFLPNVQNPEKIEVSLAATKVQYFNVAEKYGQKVVDEIGVSQLRVKEGMKLSYSLTPGRGQ